MKRSNVVVALARGLCFVFGALLSSLIAIVSSAFQGEEHWIVRGARAATGEYLGTCASQPILIGRVASVATPEARARRRTRWPNSPQQQGLVVPSSPSLSAAVTANSGSLLSDAL